MNMMHKPRRRTQAPARYGTGRRPGRVFQITAGLTGRASGASDERGCGRRQAGCTLARPQSSLRILSIPGIGCSAYRSQLSASSRRTGRAWDNSPSSLIGRRLTSLKEVFLIPAGVCALIWERRQGREVTTHVQPGGEQVSGAVLLPWTGPWQGESSTARRLAGRRR